MATLILQMKDRTDATTFACPIPDCKYGRHLRLWTVQRVRSGQLGHWVEFRLNGQPILYDPTLPHNVDRLPRDAKEVPVERAARAWHSDGHYFTLP